MFSFFALQKLVMALFITYTYNNVPFTNFIGENFLIFAISAFIFITLLFMVHVALEFIKQPPFSYIFYILFTLSECWVIAFLLATTEPSTVFLFAVTLTSMVIAICVYIH